MQKRSSADGREVVGGPIISLYSNSTGGAILFLVESIMGEYGALELPMTFLLDLFAT